ncbi:ABC transporter ATP-binding protein [Cellulosimicrobium sp. PMB13]|uniref:ABC transporter ATP-binding protein n=1 Tax=Cellulosimicrobium sp. PMB13 TaxID=3120158 RepID=UPI003F4C93F6
MVQTDPTARTVAQGPAPRPAQHAADGAGLEVRDVVVRYDGASRRDPRTTAVAGVSLDVAPGEVLALLGPSGCGKSSLLRAVAGLEPVAAGTVRFAGDDLAGVPVHRRGFGLMFQEGQLFPHRDVAGNVAYGIADVPRAERDDRVRELLGVVGLAGYERRAVTTLSGGERQRVALARSLAPRPRLLLLDEPLSALDRGLRERLALDLRAALQATGTTAVFVTHDHDEAFTVADRVAVMDAGRVLQVAPPEELWREPSSRRVAEFLGYQAFLPLSDLAGRELTGVSPHPDARDGMLAVGPRGLRVAGTPDVSGSPVHGVAARPGPWRGTVVGSVFRRGATEVTVDVALPGSAGSAGSAGGVGGAGTVRVVALAGREAGEAIAWVPGHEVDVALDPAGCAVVPA